ncbi:hypothetical protein AAFC00_002678 [Neodothiora populina]|uniref:Glutathione S-transferase kappa n=1 Tax=Neodothiora populina TaxID=2781224 RepID=A0ABR3P860_9PEZI
MAVPKLTVYLDIVSPFAYLAFYMTKNARIFKDCDVSYVPIFLGGVMKACNNIPPIEIKNKGKWIGLDRLRWSRYCNIPMREQMPDGFPPLTLQIMRVLCAVQIAHPQKLTEAFDKLYEGMWVHGNAVHKPEVFSGVLAEVLGSVESKAVIAKAGEKEVKDLLLRKTDACLAEGAFGLPWFSATNAQGQKECFWGFDHLGQVIEHLGLDRSKAPEFKAML